MESHDEKVHELEVAEKQRKAYEIRKQKEQEIKQNMQRRALMNSNMSSMDSMGFGGNAGMLVCEMLWCSYYLLIGCCVLIFSSYPYLFFFLFFLCFFLLGFAPSYSQPAMEQKPTPVQQAYYIFLLCFVLCLHTRIHIHTFFLFDLILFYFISSFMKLVLNAKVSCWERKSNLHLWKRSLKKVVIFFSISVAYFRVKCCFQN